MTSNAKDTLWPAPFDTFEPPPISAASFNGEAAFWQRSISTRFMLLLTIFAVAGALTSREQRSPITHVLECSFSIDAWWAAESARVNRFEPRTPIQLLSLPSAIGFKRIAG